MEPVSDPDGGRKTTRLSEWRTRGAQYGAGKLLGAGQTDLSERTNRAPKSWRATLVQEYLYSRNSDRRESRSRTTASEVICFAEWPWEGRAHPGKALNTLTASATFPNLVCIRNL